MLQHIKTRSASNREIRWFRKQNHNLQKVEENTKAMSISLTTDISAIHRSLDKMQNTFQNISIGVCQCSSGNEAYLAPILMPCKSTSGTGLHSTNNLITSLKTQMDEDTMYSLSPLWRLQVQMRSLITSRLEILRQKCSVNICRLKTSRQKNFYVWNHGPSPKIISGRQIKQAARWPDACPFKWGFTKSIFSVFWFLVFWNFFFKTTSF